MIERIIYDPQTKQFNKFCIECGLFYDAKKYYSCQNCKVIK